MYYKWRADNMKSQKQKQISTAMIVIMHFAVHNILGVQTKTHCTILFTNMVNGYKL